MLRRTHHRESAVANRGRARIGIRHLVIALAAAACVLSGPAAVSATAQKPVPNLKGLPEVVGTPRVGERIVCSSGSWIGTVSQFKYVWLRDAIPIAFGNTYNITFADEGHSLWCVVTAMNNEGSTEAESINSLEIGGEHTKSPENTVPPEVSGTPAVGETLSCSTG